MGIGNVNSSVRIQPLKAGKAKEPLTIIKQASRLNPQASPAGSKILADNPAFFLHDLIAITLNEEIERERIVRLSGRNNDSSLIRCFSPEGTPVYLAEAEISATPETVTVPADYPNPLLNLRIFGQRITLEGELLKKGWLNPTPESPGHGYRVYQVPRQGEKIIRHTNLVLAYHTFYSHRQQPARKLVDFGAAFGLLACVALSFYQRVVAPEFNKYAFNTGTETIAQLADFGLPVERLDYKNGDMWKEPLQDADAVYCWEDWELDLIKDFFDHFAYHLKPGTNVLANWLEKNDLKSLRVAKYFDFISFSAGIGIFRRNSRRYSA